MASLDSTQLSCRVWHLRNVLPASTCLPRPRIQFEYFRRKDGRLCRHVKLQTAERPNTWQFPSFKLLFAVSCYFHTSFKLVWNSSFKLAVKVELHFSGRENWTSGTFIGIGYLNFAPKKMPFPLNSDFETSKKKEETAKRSLKLGNCHVFGLSAVWSLAMPTQASVLRHATLQPWPSEITLLQYWDGTGSQFEARLNGASKTTPQYWDGIGS